MGIELDGCTFDGCEIGIDVSHGTNVKAVNTAFKDCQKAILERDKPSFLKGLGIPESVPSRDVHELLKSLSNTASGNTEETIKKSKVWGYLKDGQSAMTFLTTLAAFSKEMAVTASDLFK